MPINVPPSKEVWQKAKYLGDRYEKLKKIFEEFCALSAWLAKGENRLPSLVHTSDIKNNKLEIQYCGKLFRFEFAIVGQAGSSKGLITCYRIPSDKDIAPVVVDSF